MENNLAHWDDELGCYTCSFCDLPMGNCGIYQRDKNKKFIDFIRLCKNHEKEYENNRR